MKTYQLQELKNPDGTPVCGDSVKSSFACTCEEDSFITYQNEFVRVWNKHFKVVFQAKDFNDWLDNYNDHSVIEILLSHIDINYGYKVTISYDQCYVLHFNSYLNNNSFRIQCDEYIYGIVDMFNFLEIYEPKLVLDNT